MRRCLGLVLVLLAFTIPLAAAAPQRTALDELLDRAAAYVVKFEKECSAVVAEEHYTQDVRAGCRRGAAGGVRGNARPRPSEPTGPTHRELLSDVLMVQLPDRTWVGFRDVAKVDGRAVRDRSERLQSLFLKSLASLRKVQEESARYNIGHIQTTMNLPTFALTYLHPTLRDRFSFEKVADETVGGREATVVAFVERQHPTIISDGAGKDIVSTGRFWIDSLTGEVLQTRLVAGDGTSDARVESLVTYARHPKWGLLLPDAMRETYDVPSRPDGLCVLGLASYSNFRRFEVTTNEQVKPPDHE